MNPPRIINTISGSLKYLTLAVPSVAAALLGLAPTAQAQPPVTSGLVLRMDASQITGTANDAQLDTWTDTSGLANNAVRQGGSSAGFPKYVTGALNGKPVVSFNSGNGNTGDYFKFNRISTIRSVFWVIKDTSAGSKFLLGDDISYQFHRGYGPNAGKLWDSQYASDSIRNGTTKLMGAVINGTTTSLPSGSFQLVSLVTTGNVQANQICQDRIYNGSWQGDIAEILIYDRALSALEEESVGTYLSAKYALTTTYPVQVAPAAPDGVVAAPVSSGAISLSWPVVPFATTYNVSYALTGDPEAAPVTGVLGASYTVTGLTNGMSYDFKVSATNIAGTSAYSSIVTATPAMASGNDILTFVFPGQQDTVISGTDISVTVPTGTDVTALAPTYTASPYATGNPVSGTPLNFSGQKTYSITAEDGSPSKDYTVTVTEGAVPTTFTWASAVSGNWSDSAKWTNNLATVAKPNNGGKADYTLNFTPIGNYTTTQNLNNDFLVNQLNFAGAVTLAGTNSLALTSNGPTPPAISQNSGDTVTISAPLNLTTDTTFGGSGGGQVSISSGAISGVGGLTKTNSGELLISNVNSYTGKTSVNAGILRIGAAVAFTKAGVNGPLGAPVGANATIDLHNGTTLQTVGTNPRINHDTDRPLNLAGTGPGTVSLRVNDNDTRFTFGSVTASGTGAKNLALFMGSQGNGDRESLVFTGGISDSSDAPTSLSVSFNTTNSSHLSLVGTSTFTGSISTVNANPALNSVSTLTVGGLYTGPNSANGLAAEDVRGMGSLGSGNYPGNISLAAKTVLNYRSSLAQTLAGVISGEGTVTVDGLSTVTMTGLNTYTGNTTVPTGNTLVLSDSGGMSFVLTNTSANKITGAGTATLDGKFTINTAAVSNVLGTWALVDTTTKSFGATFSVAGFTQDADVWSRVDGTKTWTFTEATGVLSLTSTAVFTSFGIPGYAGVIDNNALTIRLVVPKDTNLATLAPTYTVASGTVDQPNGGAPTPTFAAAANNTVTYVLTSGATVKRYAVTAVLATGIINLRVSNGTSILEVDLEGPAGPPVPGTQTWNQLTAGEIGVAASGLLDSVGAVTTAGISTSTLNGADGWGLNASLKLLTSSSRVFSTTSGNSGSFTISGLTAGTYYDLWIASSHINGSGIGTWSTTNTNSTDASVRIDNTDASANGSTWVAGVNYVRFQSVKVNVSGNITMTVMNDVLQDNRVGFNGFQLIPVAAPTANDYDTWMASFPSITAPADKLPTADPDGDGLTNEEEYAFGLNPTLGSSANPITVPLNKTTGTFSYTRRATPLTTGLTYSVQTSTDLAIWPVDATATQTVTGTVGDVQTVQVTLSGTIPLTAPKFFVRVQAVPAP